MPAPLNNQQATSSKFYAKFEKSAVEPKVLSKSDAKAHQHRKGSRSLLDGSFEDANNANFDELGLDNPIEDQNDNDSKFIFKNYDGFQMKVLPSKEKVALRNNFLYIDPSTFGIVWHNVILFIILHLMGFYGVYKCFNEEKYFAFASSYLIGVWGGLGITAGAHRLWSHRSYKARLPLRIFLMIGHTIAGQNNLYVWCRDHRVHHKFSETDADPHNSKRGFFFAHMGWLLRKKHPDVFFKGSKVPLDDLLADPVVRFNMKFYYLFYFFFPFFLPTWMGAYLGGEGWWSSFVIASASRYMTSLHATWFVNSAAHMFGDQPYDPNRQARENPFVALAAFGEGYHNYHHTFPSDYATSESGSKLNLTKYFIDAMAFLGLAYDLKKCSKRMVERSMQRSILINERRQKSDD